MIYVYELPTKLSNGFCFSGPNPVVFANVDFMNTPDGTWGGKVPTREEMRAFIKGKKYYNPRCAYLVVGTENQDYTFLIDREAQRHD